MNKIELVVPAGGYEQMKSAVLAGADSIYAGFEKYSARAYADNFNLKSTIINIYDSDNRLLEVYTRIEQSTEGLIEATAYPQNTCFEAALLFAKAEGIIPAPESSHAIRCAIDEALKCKQTGEEKVIAFNLSGHGHFDMTAYEKYMDGELTDYEYPKEMIKKSLEKVPKVEL